MNFSAHGDPTHIAEPVGQDAMRDRTPEADALKIPAQYYCNVRFLWNKRLV